MGTNDRMQVNANRWTVTIRRDGKRTLRLHLPTLNDALSVARTDAAWYGELARVNVSPLIPSEAKGA